MPRLTRRFATGTGYRVDRYRGGVSTPTHLPVCTRHPDRETRMACGACGRPVCAECNHDGLCPQCHDVALAHRQQHRPHRPVASMVLIAASVTIFVLGQISAGFGEWAFVRGAQQQQLVEMGQGYRLITAAFLHAGLTHLLFNMWALYVLGVELERRVGALPFTALYLAAALSGGAAYQVVGGSIPVVGASGAIFGLFGSWVVVAWRARDSAAGQAGLRQMLVLLAINLALPLFIPGIAWQAHLGGFAAGVLVTGLWMVPALRGAAARTLTAAAVGATAFLVAVNAGPGGV